MQIRNRIKEYRLVRAGDLLPNPRNWRTHPKGQQDALRGILAEIGYADALLARELPDGKLELIDGHLRAETTPDQEVPVLILDLDQDEANKLLTLLDPLAAMAETNKDALGQLLLECQTNSEAVQAMLDDLAAGCGVFKITESEAPMLASGDREPFQQMTFTLHDDQAEKVKAALEKAKASGPFDGSPNENSNGNALARIAEAYLGKS